MMSLKKLMCAPKKSDTSTLARFYHADDELHKVVAELDTFDGKKEPERCNRLIYKLRKSQDKVITLIQRIIEENVENPVNRDYRQKFPDDIIHDGLSGQLWFGAECLSAGSSIMNREVESAAMRPLARALTKHLDAVRSLLRQQVLKNVGITKNICDALSVFDRLFAEFELNYVSAMVPVKSISDYDALLDLAVLMSESTQRAIKVGLLRQEMLDDYEPRIMFAIPRLAIISGLLHFPDGPMNPNKPSKMITMFRPYVPLLKRLLQFLSTMKDNDLWKLEQQLCDTPTHDLKQKLSRTNSLDCSWKSTEKLVDTNDKQLVMFVTSALKNCLNTGDEEDSPTATITDEEINKQVEKAKKEKEMKILENKKMDDTIHKLFVCISGIADQLQSNNATDMRFLLQSVFKINSTNVENDTFLSDDDDINASDIREAPRWVPDQQVSNCMACKVEFTFFNRRHHCRNCGHIFCSSCSSHSLPLTHYGFKKPVRVCNYCFSFQLMHDSTSRLTTNIQNFATDATASYSNS